MASGYAARVMRRAQRETNEMNYKIWQEQMQHEQNMYDEEVADRRADTDLAYERQTADWEREMAYNSPANQRKLWEDAGFNALNVMTDASGSITNGPSSVPQAQGASHNMPHAPTWQMAPAEAYQNDTLNNINNIIGSVQELAGVVNQGAQSYNSIAQANNARVNTSGQRITNARNEWQFNWDKEWVPKWNRVNYNDAQTRSRYLPHFLETEWNMAEDQRKHLQASTRLLQLSGDEKEILNSYADQYQQLGLIEKLQGIENMRKSGLLTDKQIDALEQSIIESEARTYKTWLESSGIDLDNKMKNANLQVFNQTMNSIVDKIRFDASLSGMQLGLAKQQYDFNEKNNPYLLKKNMFEALEVEQRYNWFPYQQVWNGFIEGGNTSANIYGAVAGGRRR